MCCLRVWRIESVVIIVVCVSEMYVQRAIDARKRGRDRSVHSIWRMRLAA